MELLGHELNLFDDVCSIPAEAAKTREPLRALLRSREQFSHFFGTVAAKRKKFDTVDRLVLTVMNPQLCFGAQFVSSVHYLLSKVQRATHNVMRATYLGVYTISDSLPTLISVFACT